MHDYAVTCRGEGLAADPTELAQKLMTLLAALKDFGPIGRIRKDGAWYQATLVVTADSDAEARRIATTAVTMAAASARMPNWHLAVVDSFELAAA